MKSQTDANHYRSSNYDNKERFCSYWHQINEIVSLRPLNVLEVGLGNGLVSEYLRRRSFEVVTIDVSKHLSPNVVSTVLKMPFTERVFDVVACFEVLEHLPYESFSAALKEIHRVAKSHVVLSLPDAGRHLRISCASTRFGSMGIWLKIPTLSMKTHVFDGEHYWEIGKAGYPLSRIVGDIRACGFTLSKNYRLPENPYHRFFILARDCHIP